MPPSTSTSTFCLNERMCYYILQKTLIKGLDNFIFAIEKQVILTRVHSGVSLECSWLTIPHVSVFQPSQDSSQLVILLWFDTGSREPQ